MVSNIPSPLDLQLFHSVEIQLFNRMVGQMRRSVAVTKLVISLWLSLEEFGYHGLLENICRSDNETVKFLFNEAVSCLECVRTSLKPPPNLDEDLAISTMANKSIKWRTIYFERDIIYQRSKHFNEEICNKIFDGSAAMEVNSSKKWAELFRHLGECFGTKAANSSWDRPQSRSSLNPSARPFYGNTYAPRDQRTMFLTFSDGYPLTKNEISDFFKRSYGNVVEDVIIGDKQKREPPKYARIVFKGEPIIPWILNGEVKVKFRVNGKQLWARKFVVRLSG
ncbi:hypothetical protein ACHQM5_011133 [Ranunculus cassubicifolius]